MSSVGFRQVKQGAIAENAPASHNAAEGGPAGSAASGQSREVVEARAWQEARSGSGSLLPFQGEMEQAFGQDFSSVKAHLGRGGPLKQLGANAAAAGDDVAFGSTSPEKAQVAHELAHVVQQRRAGGSDLSGASRPGDPAEREADSVGQDVAKGKPVHVGEKGKAALHGDWLDSLADAFGMRENEEALDLQEDIAEFKSKSYGPLTYTRSNVSGSGFEASYEPNAEVLSAEVRGKVRFADGLTESGGVVTSPNHFMNQGQFLTTLNAFPDLRAQVLPCFRWGADEKEITRSRFEDNIVATTALWSNTGQSFQVNEPGWEGVVARPDIQINVSEGDAVTATEDYGPFGILTRTDEQKSDHLQIEIVKQINAADAATVNGLITAYLAANAPGVAAPPAGGARGVRSYLGNDPGKRNSNPAGVNNFMSLESARSGDPTTRSFDHSVYFGNGKDQLTAAEQAKLDAFLANPKVLLQNPKGVTVELKGFASASGSTASNKLLVDRRLAGVTGVVTAKMASTKLAVKTGVNEKNDADATAEADPTGDPAKYRRVDIHITQTGRGGQNVAAHEFGHVFGLGDEYAEVGNGYNRTAGAAADHDALAKNAGIPGGAVVGNDNRIMSTGNQVGKGHYSTFADALRRLTDKSWKVV